jgi:hypothetical protein
MTSTKLAQTRQTKASLFSTVSLWGFLRLLLIAVNGGTLSSWESLAAAFKAAPVSTSNPIRRNGVLMKLSLLVFLTLVILFAVPVFAQTQDIYLAQSSAGGNTGADCADARAYTFFNSSSNWAASFSSGKISPGTTVHLCGTFSFGSSQGTVLTFQGSGSSGSPITLLFESGASLQAQSWSAQAIDSTGNNYLTIDGGTNGFIESTLNGYSSATCPAGACTLQQSNGSCVQITSATNIAVQNLSCGPIYVHYCPSGLEASCPDEGGSNSGGLEFRNVDSVLVTKNSCQGAWACINYDWSGTHSNVVISNNTIFYSNIGIQVTGGNSGAVLNTLIIYGNAIHDGTNWTDQANGNHHDGMHLFSVTSGNQINGLQVYNNYIYGNWGNGVNAWIFVEANGGGAIASPEIFNNLLVDGTTVAHAGNGLLSIDGSNPLILNNTMDGGTAQNSCMLWTGNGGTVENNICMNSSQAVIYKASTITAMDYNDYYNVSASGWNNGSLAKWKSSCSCDSHSITSNPNLSPSYQPLAGSPVISAAPNLTSLGITALDTGAPQNFGVAGSCGTGCIPRPPLGSGAWDAGGYQFSSSSAGRPAPPTNLTATTQ